MVSVTRGKYDSIKVEHHATVSTEKECKAKGQWKTYKEMVDKEGEEGLLVMLASKAISMRDHPRLLGAGVPYPQKPTVSGHDRGWDSEGEKGRRFAM